MRSHNALIPLKIIKQTIFLLLNKKKTMMSYICRNLLLSIECSQKYAKVCP